MRAFNFFAASGGAWSCWDLTPLQGARRNADSLDPAGVCGALPSPANLSDNTISQYTFDNSNSRLRPSAISGPVGADRVAIAQFDDMQLFSLFARTTPWNVSAYAVDGGDAVASQRFRARPSRGKHPFAVAVLGSPSLPAVGRQFGLNTISVFASTTYRRSHPCTWLAVLAARDPLRSYRAATFASRLFRR